MSVDMGELVETIEARARRIMADRARLELTWQTRGERAELLVEINDALDEWIAAQ